MFKLALLTLGAAPLVLAGLAMGADGSEATTVEPVRCEIQTNAANGMITLEGVLHADVALSGSYQFRVVSSGGAGSSNISQGGYFSAGPDGPATLGTVMLGNSGATYNASLTVEADGKTVSCTERVGGTI